MNEKFIRIFNGSGLTMYALSKKSGVPYTVINELVNEKKRINNRPGETLQRLALTLNCQIEDLLDPFPILDKTEGKYRKIHYKWKYDGTMKLEYVWKKKTKVVDTGEQLMMPERRALYPYIAEIIIDSEINEDRLEKALIQYMERRKNE